MPEDCLGRLQANDLALLTDVVRQDQRSPTFGITEWSIKRLSDKGIQNPDGLWLVSSSGHAGNTTQPWSIVVSSISRTKRYPQMLGITGSASCWWCNLGCWSVCLGRCAHRGSIEPTRP